MAADASNAAATPTMRRETLRYTVHAEVEYRPDPTKLGKRVIKEREQPRKLMKLVHASDDRDWEFTKFHWDLLYRNKQVKVAHPVQEPRPGMLNEMRNAQERAQEEIAELNWRHAAATSKLHAKHENDLANMQKKLDERDEIIAGLGSKIEKLESARKEQDRKIAKLEAFQETTKAKIPELEFALDGWKRESEKKNEHAQKLDSEAADRKVNDGKIMDEKERRMEEGNALFERNEEMKKKIKELSQQKEQLITDKRELEKTCTRLEERDKALMKEESELEKQFESARDSMQGLTQTQNGLLEDRDGLSKATDGFNQGDDMLLDTVGQGQYDNVKAELKEAQDTIAELQRQPPHSSSNAGEVHGLEAEVKDLWTRLHVEEELHKDKPNKGKIVVKLLQWLACQPEELALEDNKPMQARTGLDSAMTVDDCQETRNEEMPGATLNPDSPLSNLSGDPHLGVSEMNFHDDRKRKLAQLQLWLEEKLRYRDKCQVRAERATALANTVRQTYLDVSAIYDDFFNEWSSLNDKIRLQAIGEIGNEVDDLTERFKAQMKYSNSQAELQDECDCGVE